MFAGVNRRNGGRAPESEEPQGAVDQRWIQASAALGCSAAPPTTVLAALQPYQQQGTHPTIQEVEIMESQLFFEGANARESVTRSLTQGLGISLSVTRSRRKRRHPKRSPRFLALHVLSRLQECTGI